MNPFAILSLLSSVITIFLGNFIYYKNPNNRLNQLIGVLCFLVAYLSFVEFGLRQAETIYTAYYWLKATFLWPFLTPLLLTIVLVVTRRHNFLKNRLFLAILFIPSVLISFFTLQGNLIVGSLADKYWGWTALLAIDSPVLIVVSVWIIILGFASIILSYQHYMRSRGAEKTQMLYIFTGLTTVLMVSLVTELVLPLLSVEFPEMTYLSAVFGLLLVSYGVANYRIPALTPTLAANEIVSTITNFLIITDCERRINYVNSVGLKLLGYSEEDVKGNDVEMILTDKVSHDLEVQLKTNQIKDFETKLRSKGGISIPVLLSVSVISKGSNKFGILFMGVDITKTKAIEKEKRTIAKQTIERQSMLLDLYKANIYDQQTTLKKITETVSKTLKVDRVSVWFFNGDKSALKCADLYICKEDVHEKNHTLKSSDYPKYMDALKTSPNITAYDVMENDATSELKESYLAPNKIKSMMDIPIWLEGEIYGVLCHEQTVNMRKWTYDEQDFAISVSYIISLSVEATKRDNAQKQIIDSLEEKNVLLREIHHRVKNNMQIISSLLSLQASTIKNPEMKNMFNESQNRVRSMSMIHEQLYQRDDLSKIDFNIYVNGLIKSLFQIYTTSIKQVKWKVEIKDVKLGLETAIPCGLIINELVSNSLKHAFKGDMKGEIVVKMKKFDDTITLLVSDNGVGLPDDFNMDEQPTLGLKLVNTLVNQLEGNLDIHLKDATTFTINFKELSYKKRE